MGLDRWSLYTQMLRSRLFEVAVQELWQEGKISGEMHLGLGEEAIAAGVDAHLEPEDHLALDHRGTPPLVARGVDLVSLLLELLGHPSGLCAGRGGHMHLFSPALRAASSGIVGAAGPTAAGFALAAKNLQPGALAVAYFGEGAINQGMVMEALNLAVVWQLPVIFVCKDNGWAITTRSPVVTGGKVSERAASFGLPVHEVDGSDVESVWEATGVAARRARKGRGPSFLLAECVHLEGHFLGDPMLRMGRRPIDELKRIAGPLLRSATTADGGSPGQRTKALSGMTGAIAKAAIDDRRPQGDPLPSCRKRLEQENGSRLTSLEEEIRVEIEAAVTAALAA